MTNIYKSWKICKRNAADNDNENIHIHYLS